MCRLGILLVNFNFTYFNFFFFFLISIILELAGLKNLGLGWFRQPCCLPVAFGTHSVSGVEWGGTVVEWGPPQALYVL